MRIRRGRNNACGADLLISCAVRDIFAGETGKKGADLGRFSGTWDAGVVPPHGSRFVLLSNCRCDDTQQAVADF